jgi:hypothetical protein
MGALPTCVRNWQVSALPSADTQSQGAARRDFERGICVLNVAQAQREQGDNVLWQQICPTI